MKKKIFILLVSVIMITISASSQTIKENIDKAVKDKNVKENSSKADVIIQKKVIADSSTSKVTSAKTVVKTQGVSTVNHKKYKHKAKFKKSSK